MHPQNTYKNAHFSPRKKPENTAVFLTSYTGKEKDSETSYYYFGARYYNPDLSLWLSVDPMADKYPSLSAYAYCHWSPIKLVDPDGQDDWEVDRLGNITRCKEQPSNPVEDRIRIKHSKGWTDKNSLSGLALGTIQEQHSITLDDDVGSVMFMGGSQDDRIKTFKFVADHSNVEFSLMEFEKYDKSEYQSLLTTTHDMRMVSKEQIGDNIGSKIALSSPVSLRLHLHNHFGNGNNGWGASDSDIAFKNHILNIQRNAQKSYPGIDIKTASFGIYKCRGSDKK